MKQNMMRVLLVSFGITALAVLQAGAEDELQGEIEIDGSSTVFPITEAVAEEFRATEPDVNVNVGISGTGGGFKRFCRSETAISDASRPIKDSEVALCAENNVEWIELRVAIDGLSVMVNPENDFVSCLTTEELRRVWEPAARDVVMSWNDVRPEFPNEPIVLFGPGVDSGTFDYFTEVIVGEAGASRPDYTASEDDNVLVTGISGEVNALGYFGYAYYVENKDTLKLVAIDSGNGCVLPGDEAIESGEYTPLSRPIFIYVNTVELRKPEVAAFVRFYLEQARELVAEVGYIPLSADFYAEELLRLNN